MADGLVVGTRLEQMKAVEGWAIDCYRESVRHFPKNEKIIENLKKINLQVRKLWTRDWEAEFRFVQTDRLPVIPTKRGRTRPTSPSGNIPSGLTDKLTQIRAAAVVTLRDIKKDYKISNGSKRNIRMLASLATEVVKMWGEGGGKSF